MQISLRMPRNIQVSWWLGILVVACCTTKLRGTLLAKWWCPVIGQPPYFKSKVLTASANHFRQHGGHWLNWLRWGFRRYKYFSGKFVLIQYCVCFKNYTIVLRKHSMHCSMVTILKESSMDAFLSQIQRMSLPILLSADIPTICFAKALFCIDEPGVL